MQGCVIAQARDAAKISPLPAHRTGVHPAQTLGEFEEACACES
jgi:hypothetical protein